MSPDTTPANLPDVADRDDLRTLVEAFYQRVGKDETLGFIFNDVAAVDWDRHLPTMVDFWEKALFRSGNYRGNPLVKHRALSEKTEVGRPQFERWTELFNTTVDEHFAGERTEHLKRIAADMAQVMHSRISGEPIPFSSPQPPEAKG